MNRITNVALACAFLTVVGVAAQTQTSADFKLVQSKAVQKTDKSLKETEKQVNGKAGSNNTLSYDRDAYLVVRTGPDDDMMSFRIQGLRNPTINVKAGATMKVLFANTDDDMFHCMRFGASLPPFPVEMSHTSSVGTPDLPHANDEEFSAVEMKITAPTKPGTYSYVCTVKGHAKAGMYGTIIVR